VSDSKDLVINGYLTQETGNISTDWKSDGWLTGPGISSFSWHRTAKGGELSIINHQPNDARWMSIFTSRPPCCSRHSRRTKACVFPVSVLLLEKPPKRQDTAPSSQAPPGSETGRMLPLAGGFVLMLLLIGWRNTLPPLRTCPRASAGPVSDMEVEVDRLPILIALEIGGGGPSLYERGPGAKMVAGVRRERGVYRRRVRQTPLLRRGVALTDSPTVRRL
jgi:hypothetical protein